MSKRKKNGNNKSKILKADGSFNKANPITNFFEDAGLPHWSSSKAYGKYLMRSSAGKRMLDYLNDDDSSDDLYILKNDNLELSLAISGYNVKNFYEVYLTWWLNENLPKPDRLLDIGCDCGILTCFYATIYPEAEILGIDKNELAVDRARELADKLGLKNVRFEVQDIHNFVNLEHNQCYDLITSTTVMHEVIQFPKDLAWNLNDINLEQGMESMQPVLNGIQRLLKEDSGLYVSVDRHPIPSLTARWVRVLNHANLKVDWDRSYMLPWDCAGKVQTFTLTVSHPHINPPLQDTEEVLALLGSKEYAKKIGDLVLEGPAAELLFHSFRDKQCVFSVEFDYPDDDGEMGRIEIWQDHQIALIYEYNNYWYRTIKLSLAKGIPEFRSEALKYLIPIVKGDKLRISEYGNSYEEWYIDRNATSWEDKLYQIPEDKDAVAQ